MKLESQLLQINDINYMVEAICKKINSKPISYLPNLVKQLSSINVLEQKVDILINQYDALSAQSKLGRGEDLQGMRFQLNTLSADLNMIKKIYTASRIDKIDTEIKKIKQLDFDVETMKLKMENKVSKNEHNELYQTIEQYTPLKNFKELLDDIRDLKEIMVYKDDFNVIAEQ